MTRVPAAVARVEGDSTDISLLSFIFCASDGFKMSIVVVLLPRRTRFRHLSPCNHLLVLWQCTHCRNQHSTRVLLSLGTLFLRPRALYLVRSTQLPWPQSRIGVRRSHVGAATATWATGAGYWSQTAVPSPHAAVSHVCTPHVGHRVAIRAACSRAENTTAGMADTTVAHGSVHSLGSDAGLGDTTHGGDGGGGDSVASLRAVCRQFGIAENVRCAVAVCVRMLFNDQSPFSAGACGSRPRPVVRHYRSRVQGACWPAEGSKTPPRDRCPWKAAIPLLRDERRRAAGQGGTGFCR